MSKLSCVPPTVSAYTHAISYIHVALFVSRLRSTRASVAALNYIRNKQYKNNRSTAMVNTDLQLDRSRSPKMHSIHLVIVFCACTCSTASVCRYSCFMVVDFHKSVLWFKWYVLNKQASHFHPAASLALKNPQLRHVVTCNKLETVGLLQLEELK